jgi:hypothetical protein
MNARFLLPCECGQSVPIELSQAGQKVRCSCGRELAAPTLRGIRQLQPATEHAASVRPRASWNPVKGALFAAGSALLLSGLIAAAYNYLLYYQTSQVKPSDEEFADHLSRIEQMTPSDLWDAWHFFAEHGLGDHESSVYVQYREESRRRLKNTAIAGVIAGFGVGLALIAMVIPGRQRTQST